MGGVRTMGARVKARKPSHAIAAVTWISTSMSGVAIGDSTVARTGLLTCEAKDVCSRIELLRTANTFKGPPISTFSLLGQP